jgi:two-component system, NarL family, invasion response regulator UvrY
MKILIVEDHTILRKNLKTMFESAICGCVAIEAANGPQTLEILRKNTVDIVLLDLNLPEMHGLLVLEEIMKQWPCIKVLVMSADSYEESAVQSMQKGAWGYLTKEVDPDELIEAIETLNKGKKYLLPEVADLLINPPKSTAAEELHKMLTPCEYKVMILLAKEKSYKAIASVLGIKESTVGTHRTNLMIKMGMEKNSQLTKYCKIHKLI